MSRRLRVFLTVFGVALVVLGTPVLVVSVIQGTSVILLGLDMVIPGIALVLVARMGPGLERRLARRRRAGPFVPRGVEVVRRDDPFDPNTVALPLFERPLAHLWSRVDVVRVGGRDLRVFEMVHSDLLGEGRPLRQPYLDPRTGEAIGGGELLVTCVLAEVPAAMPLIVVRPRDARPLALPDGLEEQSTELESFNRSFRVLAADAYSATAIIDPRTIRVIREMDRRFSVEIGGRFVLVSAPRLDPAGTGRLVAQAARLMEVFPRVASSLYPAARDRPRGGPGTD